MRNCFPYFRFPTTQTRQSYDESEVRLLITQAPIGKEGLLAQLAMALKADLTISGGLHCERIVMVLSGLTLGKVVRANLGTCRLLLSLPHSPPC